MDKPQDKPQILLLSGLLCDTELWHDLLLAFKEAPTDLKLLIPELWHHDHLEVMAAEVLTSFEGPFVAIGFSMGGYLSMELMRQAPHRLKGLTLIDTQAGQDTDERRRERLMHVSAVRQGLESKTQHQPKRRFTGINKRLMPDMIHESRLDDKNLTERIRLMSLRVGAQGFLNQQAAILARPDSLSSLHNLPVPSLIICGEQDKLTPPRCSQRMAEQIGESAQLHILPRCGHMAPMEKPEIINSLIMSWLYENWSL